MSMTIKQMIDDAAACSKAKGFFDKPLNVGEQLMMVCGEAAEAHEDYRNQSKALEVSCLDTMKLYFLDAEDSSAWDEQRQEGPLLKPCGFPSELADIVIRVATLAARMDIDLEKAIVEKLKYNWSREHLHGGKVV